MNIPAPPGRAGHVAPAGLSVSTTLPDLDFETRSEAGFFFDTERQRWHGPPRASQNKKGLPVIGSRAYAEHPSTDVLCLRYDLKDGAGSRHWRPGLPIPADLCAHIASGQILEAWNVMFERLIWEHVMVPRYGAPPVSPAQWRCAMSKARAHALPGKLENAGEVLALPVQKDKDGKRLIDKFSMPRNPTKADQRLWVPPQWGDPTHADHADTLALDAYCAQDIAAEAAISAAVPDLSPAELAYWQDDQAINLRGVAIDLDAMHACVAIIEQAEVRYGQELAALTGGIAPSEIKQLLGWLHGQGVHLDSLDEEAVDDALTWVPAGPARRALEIRSAVGSASVKKVFAMRNQVSAAGRLHNLYTFYGARTGRPVGNGPQPTNLPKAGPNVHRCDHCGKWHGAHTMWCMWCHKMTVRKSGSAREWNPDAMEDAITAIGFRSLDYLELLFGDAMLTVAGVLRGLFVAGPGKELVSSDFTAIEGVVIACLAGEQWRVDAYANDEPMYLVSAERMFGTSVAEMKAYAKANGHHHPLRQKGKGGELGLGFGGWINALRQFGVDGPDDELKETVLAWRRASPALVWFWGGQHWGSASAVVTEARNSKYEGAVDPALHYLYSNDSRARWNREPFPFGLEGAAITAVQQPGEWQHVRRLDGSYAGCSYVRQGDVLYARGPSGGLITYHRPRLVQAAEEWRGLSLSFEGWNTNPKSGPPGWIRMNTYGGKLAENFVQHVARCIQMNAIRRCEASDRYPVVMHTYDEIVAEIPAGTGSVEELERLMCTPEPWHEGWPIKAAGGWSGRRYRKG